VIIVEICISTRGSNGGLIEMSLLMKYLSEKLPSIDVSEVDVESSIKLLSCLGGGYKVITLENNCKFVQSFPKELNSDHSRVIGLIQQKNVLTANELGISFGWDLIRAHNVLQDLLMLGLIWLDSQGTEKSFYKF
jgi:ESCRT-II complex subunit VPS22